MFYSIPQGRIILSDFDKWEQECLQDSQDNLTVITHSIDFAKDLQYAIFTAPARHRKQMGMEALRLLSDYPRDVTHHRVAFNIQHAYLTVHPGEYESKGHTSKYGPMRVLGQVGLFTLDRFDGSGWILSLQLFEPVQLTVENNGDRLPNKIPEPLKLPVSAIHLPCIQVR